MTLEVVPTETLSEVDKWIIRVCVSYVNAMILNVYVSLLLVLK